jgi:hypothetical protein
MDTPTFDELMEESRYAGPRRTPILDTPAVTKSVVEWFQNKNKWRAVETEMAMPAKPTEVQRRADVIAFNPTDHEFYIIEVKTQWNDFVRDRKFFDYRKWCDWFAFAVPEELAACARRRMDDVPGWYEGVGLLVIPNDYGNRRMVRRPTQYKMTRSNYTKMIERWGLSCWGRLIGTRAKIAELEWRLKNIKDDANQLKKKLVAATGDPNPTLYP